MAVVPSVSDALAKSVKVEGSGSYAHITPNFTYDGSPAIELTGEGEDNVGGSFIFQGVKEYSATSISCTAPDGTAGFQYDLIGANSVNTYKGFDQIFLSAPPSSTNIECASNTTGSFGGTTQYNVNGGSGKFQAASGTYTETFSGTTLAAPGSPGSGHFGATQFTSTGSVTK